MTGSLTDESMHHKEGSGAGDWIYLRDHTSLVERPQKRARNRHVGIHDGTF